MPGAFIGHLGLDYIDGFHWKIQTPLRYDIGRLGSGKFVLVPAHYETDFNSIPRGLWNIFPPTQYGKSSVVHDYLCTGGIIISIVGGLEYHTDPTDRQLDAIYREALEVEGCPRYKRYPMWLGVRANHISKPLQFWSKDGEKRS